MANSSIDVGVVGHLSIDAIILPSRSQPFVVMGGSAAYVSFVTRLLGGSVSVLSKVGADFPEAYLWLLREEGVDISGVTRVEAEQTTQFELKYSKDLTDRVLTLRNKAPPLDVSDVPSSFRAKAIHVGPIAGEVSLELVEHLKGCCDVLALDPQGMLRSFDAEGRVTDSPAVDTRALGLINIYKSSLNEILHVTGKADLEEAVKAVHGFGVETVLVTFGGKGALLSVGGSAYAIPAYVSDKYMDPTGAGDVFLGAYLTEYTRQKDCLWCACVGCAAASLVVERIGPTFFGEKEELYRRAESIYEKEIKP